MNINLNSYEGKCIKERRDALLQAMESDAPAGSLREVKQFTDEHGEVIVQAMAWKKPVRNGGE
jgi:hypothetical protein